MATAVELLLGRWYGIPADTVAVRDAARVSEGVPAELLAWHDAVSRLGGGQLFVQNHVVPLDQLRADSGGFMMFWYEAQYCWEWAVVPHGDDPAVLGREPGAEWHEIGMHLSGFLYWATALELALGAKDRAYVGRLSGVELVSLCDGFEPIGGSRFDLYSPEVGFLRNGALLVVIEQVDYADSGKLFSITVGSPDSSTLESYLSEVPHSRWRVAGRTVPKPAHDRKIPF